MKIKKSTAMGMEIMIVMTIFSVKIPEMMHGNPESLN